MSKASSEETKRLKKEVIEKLVMINFKTKGNDSIQQWHNLHILLAEKRNERL